MEKALRISLPIVILVLIYLVYDSVARPMREQKKIDQLEAKIITRLGHIKTAQFAYRDHKGVFAGNFDSLIYALKNEQWPIIKAVGDPEDTTTEMSYDTTYVPLYEYAFPMKDVNIDSLAFVPMNPNNAKFLIEADVININNANVPVFMVKDPEPYNKKRALTLGDMSQPVYTGNWE
ncbi:MAG: hypothetical protein LPK45_05360 [Bacteroidota bacterium]|nr:hypothetical protein [Bacteroidota bacterium]MDX5430487.1 hypothetical protein [Bacteroidota bacterium]MDX5469248.1 hypothetical protein [Bacteroidota bacterium]